MLLGRFVPWQSMVNHSWIIDGSLLNSYLGEPSQEWISRHIFAPSFLHLMTSLPRSLSFPSQHNFCETVEESCMGL